MPFISKGVDGLERRIWLKYGAMWESWMGFRGSPVRRKNWRVQELNNFGKVGTVKGNRRGRMSMI